MIVSRTDPQFSVDRSAFEGLPDAFIAEHEKLVRTVDQLRLILANVIEGALPKDGSEDMTGTLGVTLLVTQGGIAAGSQEDWHEIGASSEPGFLNSWVNLGAGEGTVAFRKDAMGFVHLKGTMKNGTVNLNSFTLPAGYRPSDRANFAVVNSGSGTGVAARVVIFIPGGVRVVVGASNSWVSLDGINFYAGN